MPGLYMRFPNGVRKAVTLSYDDGVEQDRRLIEIMKKNGLKGTFNLNSGLFAQEGVVYPKGQIHRRMSLSEAQKLYIESGVEVAVHGLTHPDYTSIPQSVMTCEIVKDRENLEKQFGRIVRGSAYPFGTYNDAAADALEKAGIVYARTVISSHSFRIPSDWLRLEATCHHADPQLMPLAEKFIENLRGDGACLFYLWGHSFEFERDDNWNVIEAFAEYVGNRDDVWYASNIEIYDYVKAYRHLNISWNGNLIENQSALTIWIYKDGETVKINPGEIIKF